MEKRDLSFEGLSAEDAIKKIQEVSEAEIVKVQCASRASIAKVVCAAAKAIDAVKAKDCGDG